MTIPEDHRDMENTIIPLELEEDSSSSGKIKIRIPSLLHIKKRIENLVEPILDPLRIDLKVESYLPLNFGDFVNTGITNLTLYLSSGQEVKIMPPHQSHITILDDSLSCSEECGLGYFNDDKEQYSAESSHSSDSTLYSSD